MNRSFIEFIKIPEGIRIPYFGGVWLRFVDKLCNKSILTEQLPENPLNTEPRDEIVIASLTSYPKRISTVHLAIKSLLLQTYKPDRVVLWLAEEQFPDKKLPDELTALCKYGLEIIWMHDIYGHKKYFYPIVNQKDSEVIITFDDDIIYSPKLIERLMKTHKKFPNCLVCERGQTFDASFPNNPGKWNPHSAVGVKVPTYSINPSPGGGCLIPKNAFHSDATDENKICSLAYKNDDLWYMFMSAENETKIVKTRKNHRTFSVISGSQTEQMATENVVMNKNEAVMQLLKEAYPLAWERISNIK